jgi:phage host-nuclease inhibitor protein Gam
MKIQSGNKIEKVILICNDASGSTLYNGNKTATVTAGTLDWADDNKTVTINDVNSNVVELVNKHTTNSGGVQLRIHDIKIYYAK